MRVFTPVLVGVVRAVTAVAIIAGTSSTGAFAARKFCADQHRFAPGTGRRLCGPFESRYVNGYCPQTPSVLLRRAGQGNPARRFSPKRHRSKHIALIRAEVMTTGATPHYVRTRGQCEPNQ